MALDDPKRVGDGLVDEVLVQELHVDLLLPQPVEAPADVLVPPQSRKETVVRSVLEGSAVGLSMDQRGARTLRLEVTAHLTRPTVSVQGRTDRGHVGDFRLSAPPETALLHGREALDDRVSGRSARPAAGEEDVPFPVVVARRSSIDRAESSDRGVIHAGGPDVILVDRHRTSSVREDLLVRAHDLALDGEGAGAAYPLRGTRVPSPTMLYRNKYEEHYNKKTVLG